MRSPHPAQSGPRIVTPDQISGLQLWLDASRRSSLTLDGSNRCSQWADLSGQGNHVTQATDDNKPTLAAAAVNGLDALLFDDASEQGLLCSSAVVTNVPLSQFVVFRLDNAGAGTYSLMWITRPDSDSIYLGAWVLQASGIVQQWAGGGTAGRVNGSGASEVGYEETSIFAGRFESTTSREFRINGGTTYENTQDSGVYSSLESVGVTSVGYFGRASAGQYFSGHLCEVLTYDSVLSDARTAEVESYLANKWGVTLA